MNWSSRTLRERSVYSGALRQRGTPGSAVARQAIAGGPALPEHERRSGTGLLRRRHGGGHHHRHYRGSARCSSSPATRPSPTRGRADQTFARSAANSACATCWRAACAGPEVADAHLGPVGRCGERWTHLWADRFEGSSGGRVRAAGSGDRERGGGDRAEPGARRRSERVAASGSRPGEPAGVRPACCGPCRTSTSDPAEDRRRRTAATPAARGDPRSIRPMRRPRRSVAWCQWCIGGGRTGGTEATPAVADMVQLAQTALAVDGDDPRGADDGRRRHRCCRAAI